MEECQKLGLTKSIGVSNFSCKKLDDVLATAKIPPAVNQVEVSPCWQQKKLREFCKSNGVLVVGYGPLGSVGTFYGTNRVMESEVLKEIAKAKGKTVAQVLCKSHPVEFASYFHYCHSLTFDQRPDYGFLKCLFCELFTCQGYEFDYVFDWTILKYQQAQTSKPQHNVSLLACCIS